MRYRVLFASLCMLLPTVALVAQPPTPPPFATHRNLDWSTLNRWVHIDNVDPAQETLFVNCRHRWLKNIHEGDSVLGDGRPLFWCASTDSSRTYYTLYPFRIWADLDARSVMALHTNKLIGDDRVKAYDAGDQALIPPHGSQFWRHVVSDDIVATGIDSLSELTASVGRMEFRLVDWANWDQYETTYAEFRDALLAQRFPLVCRVFSNNYGGRQGEHLLWWLARDSAQFAAAPSITLVLEKQLGQRKAEELLSRLNKFFPIQWSAVAKRRDDMSNLGREL